MGIIQSGFLISAKKSAGGINFYQAGGQTRFRNKPQVSKSYVPSSAQVLQRNVVAAVGRWLSGSAVNRQLIAALWGGGGKTPAMSNFSNIVRFFVRQITRDSSGLAVSSFTAAVNLDRFVADPGSEVSSWQLLSRSSFPPINESVLIPEAGGGASLSYTLVAEYKALLAATVSREFDNDIPPMVAVQNSQNLQSSSDFAVVSDIDSVELVVGGNVVALLFPRASISDANEVTGWAGTQQFSVSGIV